MKIQLLAITAYPEKLIEEAGRTCYQSDMGNPGIIKSWIKSGHESVIEHASATFKISGISRACSHQLVRHRIASYSQQSQRYVNESKFDFVAPPDIQNNSFLHISYNDLMQKIQNTYDYLIRKGIKKEDARFILPNACCTEIVMSANFREWRHFLKLRLDKHAQWEIRAMAGKILKVLKENAPNVFFDFDVA